NRKRWSERPGKYSHDNCLSFGPSFPQFGFPLDSSFGLLWLFVIRHSDFTTNCPRLRQSLHRPARDTPARLFVCPQAPYLLRTPSCTWTITAWSSHRLISRPTHASFSTARSIGKPSIISCTAFASAR